MISDPTYEEEQLASGTISITVEGGEVVHMYKPGKYWHTTIIQLFSYFTWMMNVVGGSSLDEKKVSKLIQQAQVKAKEVVELIEEACSSSSGVERWDFISTSTGLMLSWMQFTNHCVFSECNITIPTKTAAFFSVILKIFKNKHVK